MRRLLRKLAIPIAVGIVRNEQRAMAEWISGFQSKTDDLALFTAPGKRVFVTNISACDKVLDECLRPLSAEQVTNITHQLRDKKEQLENMQEKMKEIDLSVERHVSRVIFGNFIFLATQFVVLFKWTFFTFDWNLVEPVTYFLGYTCVWLGLMFYAVTGKNFTYDAIVDRCREKKKGKLLLKYKIDESRVEELDREIQQLNRQLLDDHF